MYLDQFVSSDDRPLLTMMGPSLRMEDIIH